MDGENGEDWEFCRVGNVNGIGCKNCMVLENFGRDVFLNFSLNFEYRLLGKDTIRAGLSLIF
jgi:hypothetical protein